MSQIILDKVVPPSAPSAGSVAVYVKSDGLLYIKDETGLERLMSASGINFLSALDYIDFDTATAFSNTAGRMTWNDVDGTLNLGLKGGSVILQLGQEQVVRVFNNTGSAFTDAQVIRITGSVSTRMTAALALASTESTSEHTFAIVTENIGSGSEGFATVSGLVRDIDTSAFAEGARLYLSPTTPGSITTTKPVAPNHVVAIGWCVRSHPSLGSIFVNVVNGFELYEIHDVAINGILNSDVLVWDTATSLWKNKSITSVGSPTILKTSAYTATVNDHTIRVDASMGNIIITLPTASTCIGKIWVIKKIDSSNNTVTISATQNIDGALTKVISTQYTSVRVQSNGTTFDII